MSTGKPLRARHLLRLTVLGTLMLGAAGVHFSSEAHAANGTPVPNQDMPALEGGKAALLKDVETNVLVFFRPQQEKSVALLKELAQCQTAFNGKSVAWVGIVPGAASVDAVKALVAESRFAAASVLLDTGDALYGSLGLAMHPVVTIIGRDKKLAAFEAFRSVDFCAVISARLRNVMHELSDADMGKALEPAKATQGGDTQVARRYRVMAENFFKDKNLDKAADYVGKSLAKDPGLAAAHALQGQILQAQGQCTPALAAFTRALELDASLAAAQDGLQACKAPR